jgi:hypothetical protein
LNALESIAVHTSSETQAALTHPFAYQVKGENAGPYLGFFTRDPDATDNSASPSLPPSASELSSAYFIPSTTLKWRTGNTRLQHVKDDMVIDPGSLDLPPLPSPEPPEPTVPEHLPVTFMDSIRLAPIIREGIEIRPIPNREDLQARKAKIELLFQDNQLLSAAQRVYLEEGFYFIPVYIAINLQMRGYYREALEWFRTVYDFTAPEDQRKIYYGLIEEETFAENYERMVGWLLDPLNPHSIAQNRPNTYTRFTLLSIVQCLAAFADAEFSKDTAESISKAATLYQTALSLLQSSKPLDHLTECQSIIMNTAHSLRIQDEPEEAFVKDILGNLGKIKNLSLLRQTANTINAVLEENSQGFTRLNRISNTVNDAAYSSALNRKNFAEISNNNVPVYNKLLQHPQLADIVDQVAWIVEQDFDHTFSVLTGRPKNDLQKAVLSWLGKKDRPIAIQRPLAPGNNQPKIKHFETINHIAKNAPNTIFTQNQVIPLLFTPGNGYDFCVPPNPIVQALKNKVDLNLEKILQGRNIAGFKREIEPYAIPIEVGTGLPALSDFGGIILPNANLFRPTLYRYVFLIERARQMANFAQQIESTFLSILEKRDAEFYNLIKSKQDVTLSFSNVRLHLLRLMEARDGVVLAQLQRDRAGIQVDHYQELLSEGKNFWENLSLGFTALSAISSIVTAISGGMAAIGAKAIVAASAGSSANALSSMAGFASQMGGFERREEEWQLALQLAQEDVKIGNQQIRLANDRVNITNQELSIAGLQANHSQETLEFLTTKFTNLDLYEWMSAVLENIYSTILQQATSVAQLAAQQLAFERQQPIPRFIQSNYWEAPLNMEADLSGDGNAPDRKGLTGSARLLKDIILLETHAFDTEQRKQQLSKTFSLAQFSPAEFQLFRETGRLAFEIPMEMFDRDFPGHYLRLIKRLTISLIALVPPVQGIKASLRTTGISRVVISNNGQFEETTIKRLPEKIDYTAPFNSTGLFDFELQQQNEMLRPFEGNGVACSWEFELPKAANQFDYNTIADVLITMDYTALYSDDYRRRVIANLDRRFSADRAFSFRRDFPDQWYDLNHPEQSNEPMVVQFETLRGDFPANIEGIQIKHAVLYFVRKDGFTKEIDVTYLRFQPQGGVWLGDSAVQNLTTIEGILSTRTGSFSDWDVFRGKIPVGQWSLALQDSTELRQWFRNEQIEDVLFVLSFEGETAKWT